MEQKGINTITNDVQSGLSSMIANYLRQGVPPTIISLIIDNIGHELKIISQDVIKEENKKCEEEKKQKSNKVE